MLELAASSPHLRTARRSESMMILLIIALLPGMLISSWFFGYGLLLNALCALLLSSLFEAMAVAMRGASVQAALGDRSVLVTALLFAIAVPPGSPWWLLASGLLFAVFIAKHAFGGLGQNPFNPAMSGFLFLLLAFPSQMSAWHIPAGGGSVLSLDALQQSLVAMFPGLATDGFVRDGMAMATPLMEHGAAAPAALPLAWSEGLPMWQPAGATGWELANLGYLAGGLLLLLWRVIDWRIPLTILLTMSGLVLLGDALHSESIRGSVYTQLLGGATLIAAFFVATDPETSATSRRARLAYGALIGTTAFVIREWAYYPDAMAIAVLFGNFSAPLLDEAFRPSIFGDNVGAGDRNRGTRA